MALEKYLRGAELPKATGDFEADYEVWISFTHKIRSAFLGADFQSVFELKVAEHTVGDVTIAEKSLSLLAEGASLDAKDDSAADAHWVATAAVETHAAMVTAIGRLAGAVKKETPFGVLSALHGHVGARAALRHGPVGSHIHLERVGAQI